MGIREDLVGLALPSCMDFFATGALVVYASSSSVLSRALRLVFKASLACLPVWLLATCWIKVEGNYPPGFVAYDGTLLALGFAGLIHHLVYHPRSALTQIMQTPVLVKIGVISYGVYLYHNLAQKVGQSLLWRVRGTFAFSSEWAQALYLTAITLFLAALSYLAVERPLRAAITRRFREKVAVRAAQV
jgi:peptidoglycan/LPS O-acetylase OafA/YrhL